MKNVPVVLLILWFAGPACGGGNKTIQPPPPPPVVVGVTSITPSSGTAAGGTAVTITGSNFATGATVTIGAVALTGVTVVNSTTITGTTAQTNTAGPSTVAVTTNGQTVSLQNGFTYIAVLRAVISGGTSTIQHDSAVAFRGTDSTTTSPYIINSWIWDCGQDPTINSTCKPPSNPTPMFTYRRCTNSPPSNPPRPPCTSTDRRTYTVTLTVTDTQGNQNTTTFNITVTNKY